MWQVTIYAFILLMFFAYINKPLPLVHGAIIPIKDNLSFIWKGRVSLSKDISLYKLNIYKCVQDLIFLFDRSLVTKTEKKEEENQ